MKIEVMVDKDNTHFSYKFDCDKVIDGSRARVTGGGTDDNAKLVILKKVDEKTRERTDTHIDGKDTMETIAVFNCWTFWRIIPEDAKKCSRCGRFEKLNDKERCQRCQDKADK